MATKLNPYLHFKDTAREAMEFYQSVLGGELKLNTFGESQMPVGAGEENNIMHAQLDTPGGLTLMASDTPEHFGTITAGKAVTVSLSGENDEELSACFAKLSEGGKVEQPLVAAPWGDKFGMVTDKFGVSWMVNVNGAGGEAAPAA